VILLVGASNFFLFILFAFVVYLYVRNYLTNSSYQKESELAQSLFDGIKKQDDNRNLFNYCTWIYDWTLFTDLLIWTRYKRGRLWKRS